MQAVAVAVVAVGRRRTAARRRAEAVREVVGESARAGRLLVSVRVVGVRGRSRLSELVGGVVGVVGRAARARLGQPVPDCVVRPPDERVVRARAARLEADAREPVACVVAVSGGARDRAAPRDRARIPDRIERVDEVRQGRRALRVLHLGQAALIDLGDGDELPVLAARK